MTPDATRYFPVSRLAAVVAALCVLVLGVTGSSRADHSLGNACLTCHALRSTGVVAGSRNILSTAVQDALYQSDFYCAAAWAGGEPLDCSYCHGSAGDIANEIALSAGGANGSAHPVDVGADSASYGAAIRITCNDCHNGNTDDLVNPGPDLTPDTLCSKLATDGYPNHHSVVLGATDPGTNNLPDNPPRLSGPYGPLGGGTSSGGGVDWTPTSLAAADLMCFVCHDGSGTTDPPFSSITEDTAEVPAVRDDTEVTNITYRYNRPNAGHNVTSGTVGSLTGKLPCYDCHDPHAATSPDNEGLIINGADSPANPYGTSNATVSGYTGANDRVVCTGCHGASVTVEGVTPTNVFSSWTPVFAVHANAHDDVQASGNCLQQNNGCHFNEHNTDIYRCLDCHSTNATVGTTGFPSPYNAETHLPPGKTGSNNARLLAVDHIDSVFDDVGYVRGNGVLSWHDIPYRGLDYPNDGGSDHNDDDPTADMSLPVNNGCVACHTPTGTLPLADADCLACHDDGNSVSFQSYPAPEIGRFYDTSGHGLNSGSYLSGNSAPSLTCRSCHLPHGSTAYKLLPGNGGTTDGHGQVTMTVGAVDSSRIDYTDYTVYDHNDYDEISTSKKANEFLPSTGFGFPYPAYYLSNYTRKWTTYSDDTDLEPNAALVTPFGTSGSMRSVNSDALELDCGDDADTLASGAMVGFCNACHFFNDTANGVTDTYGRAYTHEGVLGGTTCDASSRELKSEQFFFKDCAECHDPHGSGGSTTDNLYMIRGKVKHGATTTQNEVETAGNWSTVVFTSVDFTSPPTDNSYDDTVDGSGAAANNGDLCSVCHVQDPTPDPNGTLGVDHNYRSEAGLDAHGQEGQDCMICHNHNSQLVTNPSGETNIAAVGFGLSNTCTGCHGLPPIAPGQTPVDAINELVENYPGGGGAHQVHVEFLRAELSITGYNAALCVPCHGAAPGGAAWHLESGSPAAWDWPDPTGATNDGLWQEAVDIIDGTGAYFGAEARYVGAPADPGQVEVLPGQVVGTGVSAKGGEPQQCRNLNCHGPGAPYNANPFAPTGDYSNGTSRFAPAYPYSMRLLWDFTIPAYGSDGDSAGGYPGVKSVYDPFGRDIACAGCHGSTAPDTSTLGVAGEPDTQIDVGGYSSALGAQGATANYFGTVSGYSRGGHGDPEIQNEDPGVDSDPGNVTPLSCTACHDDTAAHFPEGGNLHRLANTTIEEGTHNTGLCNSCHVGGSYPAGHHPSYFGPTAANPTPHSIVTAAGQEIYTVPTSWSVVAPPAGHYEQDGYSGSAWSGNPDYYVDWWSGLPATSPAPSPLAILPVEQYVLGSGTSDNVMCVTCHNPHGTDLFTFDPGGIGAEIPDNNMLRLRDSDNTLCNGCH